MEHIQEANNDGRVDQLNALRFEMQSGKRNCPIPYSGGISENVTPAIWNAIQGDETYEKYGVAARKAEFDATGDHGAFAGIHFSGIPDGEGVFN